MLKDFLQQNEGSILALTEQKTLELAGDHPSSAQLKRGLPSFYRQIISVIGAAAKPNDPPPKDVGAIARAADKGDEPAMAEAAGQPGEAELARSAGLHGVEMLRLGYTLSHVVHAYGSMCQSITKTAADQDAVIGADEFRTLNRCLDVAIAGAVTHYQAQKDSGEGGLTGPGGPGLADEMRRTLVRAQTAFEAVQKGTVGSGGNTAQLVTTSLARLEQLIDQSQVAGDAPRPGRGSA